MRNAVMRLSSAVAAIALVAGGVLVVGPPASATTMIAVTTNVDGDSNGACNDQDVTTVATPVTLRNALCVANNTGGTFHIRVPAGQYRLTEGELVVGTASGTSITISGAGADVTAIRAASPWTPEAHRVMTLDPRMVGGVDVRLEGLTIADGADNTWGGGGIFGGSGNAPVGDSLTIIDSVVENNVVNSRTEATNRPGGGVQFVGGSLMIENTIFRNNDSNSSPGGAVAYQAMGEAPGEALRIVGSTFEGNAAHSVGTFSNGGAGIVIDDLGGAATLSISGSRFTSNRAVGRPGAPARGAGIWLKSGTLDLVGSHLLGNSVTGPFSGGAAVHVESEADLNAHGNRFGGHATPGLVAKTTVDAANNWWGCPAGPGRAGCDTVEVQSPRDVDPWLTLTATADPVDIVVGEVEATVTASVLRNSAGGLVDAGDRAVLEDLEVKWSSVQPTDAVVTPGSGLISDGVTTATFTAAATRGAASVTATLGGGSVRADFGLLYAPVITSDPASTRVNAGTTATFTASAVGYHPPTVQWQRSTDGGTSFHDLVGEIAPTLAFTAQQHDDASQYRAVFSNATGVATTGVAVLTVGTPPVLTSADTATIIAGDGPQHVTISSDAVPDAALSLTGAPEWVSLTDHGDGTATISADPAKGSGGHYVFTVTADNAFDPAASQTFTLVVHEAPRLAPEAQAEFRVGDPGFAVIEASPVGFPLDTALTIVGDLPAGVSIIDLGDGTAELVGVPQPGTGGVYPLTVRADNSVGSATQSLTLTVLERPVIELRPVEQRVIDGSTASFVAAASGYPSPSVRWQVSGDGITFADLEDETDGTLAIAAHLALSGNLYRAVFSNSSGETATSAAPLFVGTEPVVTSAPATTFVAGVANSFTVTTAGIPSASGSLVGAPHWLSLTPGAGGTVMLEGTPPLGSGGDHPFLVRVTNEFGGDDQAFLLTVVQSPVITSGAAATFTVGEAGDFAITATPGAPSATTVTIAGELPAGIEFESTAGSGTATISGEPSAGTGGVYSLIITASNGSAPEATQALTLTVLEAPVVTLEPGDAAIAEGMTVTFTADAGGHPLPSVQWQRATKDSDDWVDIEDADSRALTFTAGPHHNGTSYRAVFTNVSGSVATARAELLVGHVPGFTSPNSAVFIVGGGPQIVSVATSGQPAPELTATGLPEWLTLLDQGDGTGVLAGDPPPGSGGIHAFELVASNVIGPDSVQSFSLIVDEAPTLDATGAATFTVGAAGAATIVASGGYPSAVMLTAVGALPGGVTFTDHGNGTATIEGVPQPGAGGEYVIDITASNGTGVDAAQTFALTVNEHVLVTLQPSDHAVATGTAVSFTASASGHPAPAVQWQVSTDGGASFFDISGATSTTLTLDGTMALDGNLYRARFTGTGNATTRAALLTVGVPAAITSGDRIQLIAGGGEQRAQLTASGIPTPALALAAAPAWLTLVDDSDGAATLIANPPAGSGGLHTATITASNGFGAMATQTLTIEVWESPTIDDFVRLGTHEGTNTVLTLSTSGGHPSPPAIAVSGDLPLGMHAVDNGDGTVTFSGTPAVGAAGIYTPTIIATNGVTAPASHTFTIEVVGPPIVTSADAVPFMHGVDRSFTISTVGGHPSPTRLTLTGTLPSGLTFTDLGDGTAEISGRATDPVGHTAVVTVTPSNANSTGVPRDITITVVPVASVALPAVPPMNAGLLHAPSGITAGQAVTVWGDGFVPGAPVTVGMYSSPVTLGTAVADATGRFEATVTIPAGTRGVHTLVAAGFASTGTHFLAATTAVTAPAALPATGASWVGVAAESGLWLLGVGLLLVVVARWRRRRA